MRAGAGLGTGVAWISVAEDNRDGSTRGDSMITPKPDHASERELWTADRGCALGRAAVLVVLLAVTACGPGGSDNSGQAIGPSASVVATVAPDPVPAESQFTITYTITRLSSSVANLNFEPVGDLVDHNHVLEVTIAHGGGPSDALPNQTTTGTVCVLWSRQYGIHRNREDPCHTVVGRGFQTGSAVG